MEFTLETNEGAYDLKAGVRLIGQDLLVAIWGGQKPHIGAVSMAQPRPSLKDPEITSATASVFCFLGHKEDELAKAVSEILASALKTKVVVTAGIHWDNIDKEGIQRVVQNTKTLVDLILDRLGLACT
ncbi:MAG TPA: hypothetical protein DDW42_08330 [Desulfobacteraceae bacterium]|nr:hypothetical protein [Desulfobacteraceae bacterium]